MSLSTRALLASLGACAGLAAIPASPTRAETPANDVTATASSPDSTARAPDDDRYENAKDPWRAEVTGWIWAMGINGDIGVKGATANASATFVDIVENSDSLFAFSGRLELGYEKFGVFVDGMYAKLGLDNASGPDGKASIDITYEQSILDFGLMYRAGEWEPTGAAAKNARNTTLDLYAGGRYNSLKLELDPANEASVSSTKDWVDPIIGAKLVLPIAEHWHFALNGDIGGFSVASDLTWSLTAIAGYDFPLFGLPASFKFGIRAIDWNYTEGGGSSKFTWDVAEYGVILGFGIQF